MTNLLPQGITFKDTPSHGYYYASGHRLLNMPVYLRRYSYEEDCEWALLVLAFPDDWSDKDREIGLQLCKDYYPDLYELHTGEKLTGENSLYRKREEFAKANLDKMITTSACGSWHEDVPAGFVGVTAIDGETWAERYIHSNYNAKPKQEGSYLVPEQMYRKRESGNGFVINDDCKPFKFTT